MLCKQDKKQTDKMLKITIEVWLNHISIIGNGDMLCYAMHMSTMKVVIWLSVIGSC